MSTAPNYLPDTLETGTGTGTNALQIALLRLLTAAKAKNDAGAAPGTTGATGGTSTTGMPTSGVQPAGAQPTQPTAAAPNPFEPPPTARREQDNRLETLRALLQQQQQRQ